MIAGRWRHEGAVAKGDQSQLESPPAPPSSGLCSVERGLAASSSGFVRLSAAHR